MRLDKAIVERYGYSRNKAQAFIESGIVIVDGVICTKPAYDVSEDSTIVMAESPELSWVSRSAGKLEGFFSELSVGDLSHKTALDIGASTGGFTQILLSHGVAHVDAVDVGTLQLHESIRRDARVSSYENTDIREFFPSKKYDIITIDVSFISLREIVPTLERLLRSNTDVYVLYKPQFEVGREHLRKTGVPRDIKIIEKSLREFVEFLKGAGYDARKISESTVIGEAGNQEYMMYIVR